MSSVYNNTWYLLTFKYIKFSYCQLNVMGLIMFVSINLSKGNDSGLQNARHQADNNNAGIYL